MWDTIAGLFRPGSDQKTVIERLDNLDLSDQERVGYITGSLKDFVPFKKTQRIISITYMTMIIIGFLISLLFYSFGAENSHMEVLVIMERLYIPQTALTIVGFYFLGGVIPSK